MFGRFYQAVDCYELVVEREGGQVVLVWIWISNGHRGCVQHNCGTEVGTQRQYRHGTHPCLLRT